MCEWMRVKTYGKHNFPLACTLHLIFVFHFLDKYHSSICHIAHFPFKCVTLSLLCTWLSRHHVDVVSPSVYDIKNNI